MSCIHSSVNASKVLDTCGNVFVVDGNDYICTHTVKYYYNADQLAALKVEHENRKTAAEATNPQVEIDAATAAIAVLDAALIK